MATGAALRPAAFLVVIWTFFGLAAVFVAVRTVVKLRCLKQLWLDDAWLLLAFVLLLANAVLQTVQTPDVYFLVDAGDGATLDHAALVSHTVDEAKLEFAIINIYITILWAVKAAFLALFWRLFAGLRICRRRWWAATVFAIVTYIGSWLSAILTCSPVRSYFEYGACEGRSAQINSDISVIYMATADVLTDVIIICFALRMAAMVKRTWSDKVGLAIALSLTAITIVIAIVRACEIRGRTFADPVRLALWGAVESSVAVIVGCLPVFRVLSVRRRNSQAVLLLPAIAQPPVVSPASEVHSLEPVIRTESMAK